MAHFTAERKEQYCKLLAKGHRPILAAEECEVSYQTVRNHMKSDPKFAEAAREANMVAVEKIEAVLYQKAEKGHLGAIKEWLHNVAPDRWRNDAIGRIEVTGAGGGPIQIAAAATISLREVLSDETRPKALEMMQAIPATAIEVPRDD